MNIPPSEAKQLTLAEYQGLIENWNRAQGGGEAAELEPPSKEQIERRQRKLAAQGVRILN